VFHPKGPTFLELARQGLSSTRRGYDLLAPKFDYTPFRTPDAVLAAVARELAPFDEALDVCCGTGAGVWMLRPLGKRIVGLDVSPGMLAEARRQLSTSSPEGADVELLQGDALELPFASRFDLVTSFGAFGHILPRDEPRFVRGVQRALKPGGTFAFVTARRPRPFSWPWLFGRTYNAAAHIRNAIWRPEFIMFYLTFVLPEVQALLEKEGFRVELRERIFPAPYSRAILVLARKA